MSEPPLHVDQSTEQTFEPGSPQSCGSCSWWRLPVLLALVLAAMLALRGNGVRNEQQADLPPIPASVTYEVPTGETVLLKIRPAKGIDLDLPPLAWRAGMTVADLLAAGRQATGLDYAVRGSGASAFLSEMAGATNEGADGHNWTYLVNGERADRSFAVYELEPGDEVLWSFGPTD